MKTIRLFASLATLAAASFVPSQASSQATLNGETTLYACYVPKSGTVYRIKVANAPIKCAQNHVEFTWSVGATTSLEIVEERTQVLLDDGELFQTEMACPAGTVPVSGGFLATDLVIIERSIRHSLNPQAWQFRARHTGPTGGGGGAVTLSVLCLKS